MPPLRKINTNGKCNGEHVTNTDDNQEAYFVEIPLNLYFKTDEPVAIKDVAKSLLAIETMAKRFPGMLTDLTGIDIDHYELSVSKIETGSLIEALGLMVFLSSPEQRQALFDFLENSPMGKPIKYSLMGLLALLLVSESYQLLTQFTKSDAPTIQGNHNTLIQITADQIGTTPDEVRLALNNATQGKRKELVRAGLDVAAPIENHENASLHAGESATSVSIPAEAIQEVPFDVDFGAYEHSIGYIETLLQIRVLDRDSVDAGWKGMLPNVLGDARLRILFDTDVDMDLVTTQPEVTVDATVTYRNDINKGALVPKYITVTKVYPLQQ
ncbi:hypothetical protein SAMN04487867_12956 [Vreelandella titanicae]|nr:hypothetical protein SAMN04487867_12956 [Halomonas titanicae]